MLYLVIAILASNCAQNYLKLKTVENYKSIGAIRAMVIDPDNKNTMYIGTDNGLYVIENLNGKVKLELIDLENIRVNTILLEKQNKKKVLYVGTFCCGLYEFTKAKKGWIPRYVEEVGNSGISSIVKDIVSPEYLYVLANKKLFRSKGYPRHFEALDSAPKNTFFKLLVIDPASPEYLRLVCFDNKYFISKDKGNTWEEDPTLKTYLHSWIKKIKSTSVSANFSQEKEICWRAVNVLLASDAIFTMKFHPKDPKIIYVGSLSNGLSLITRIENKWEITNIVNKYGPVFDLTFDPDNSKIIYIGTKDNIYVSKNGGDSWKKLLP